MKDKLQIGAFWVERSSDGEELWGYAINRPMTEGETAGVEALLECIHNLGLPTLTKESAMTLLGEAEAEDADKTPMHFH